jgi:uncharacterized protein (DUF3820 family)
MVFAKYLIEFVECQMVFGKCRIVFAKFLMEFLEYQMEFGKYQNVNGEEFYATYRKFCKRHNTPNNILKKH